MALVLAKKSTYRDIDISFMPHPVSGDIIKKYDDDAIKQSVRTIILTNFGTKPYRHWFGSSVYQLLFNPYTPGLRNILESEIRKSLLNYEPRITVTTISVSEDQDNRSLSINLTYNIIGQTQSFNQVLLFPTSNAS